MSTYWNLECLDHDPPLISEYEVEQHIRNMPAFGHNAPSQPVSKGSSPQGQFDPAEPLEGQPQP